MQVFLVVVTLNQSPFYLFLSQLFRHSFFPSLSEEKNTNPKPVLIQENPAQKNTPKKEKCPLYAELNVYYV